MQTYLTVQGDTWDSIAYKFYEDEAQIELLMQNNFKLLDYFVFPQGIEMTIPDLPDEEEDEEYPEWRGVDEEEDEDW